MEGGRADGTAHQPSRRRRDRRRSAAALHLTGGTIDWYTARAAGIAAYVVLTFVVSVGLAMSGNAGSIQWRGFDSEEVRRFGARLVGWLVALHVPADQPAQPQKPDQHPEQAIPHTSSR